MEFILISYFRVWGVKILKLIKPSHKKIKKPKKDAIENEENGPIKII